MPCFDIDLNVLKAAEDVRTFINSAFVSAFISSLAGAGFGVWGAQLVAERSARRKELRDALKQTNALVVLSTTICNQALALKQQNVAPLSQEYFYERKIAHERNEIYLTGGAMDTQFTFKPNLVHVTALTVPIEALKNIAYAAPNLPGIALALVAMVELSLTELSNALSIRSRQIDLMKDKEMPNSVFLQTYFGLRRSDGNTDAMFHNSMEGMTFYTDDVAFFSAELSEVLQVHAENIVDRLKILSKDAGTASTVDFTAARESGLMPSSDKYENWLSGFKK